MPDAPALMCDEPAGYPDRAGVDDVRDLLDALNRRRDQAIIVATRDPAVRATRQLHHDKANGDGAASPPAARDYEA